MGRGHYYLAGIRSDGRTIWHGRSSYLLPGTAGCHGYTVTVTAGPSAAARARARRPAASSDRHGPTRTRTVTVTVTTRRPSAGLRLQLSAVSPPVDPRDPEPEGHRRRASVPVTEALTAKKLLIPQWLGYVGEQACCEGCRRRLGRQRFQVERVDALPLGWGPR